MKSFLFNWGNRPVEGVEHRLPNVVEGSGDDDFFFSKRMLELQSRSMEEHGVPAVLVQDHFVVTPVSVSFVAEDVVIDVFEVSSYLVHATCFGLDLYK